MKRRKPDRLRDVERTRRRAYEGNRRARFLDHNALLKEVARRLKHESTVTKSRRSFAALVRLKLEAAEGRSGSGFGFKSLGH